MASLWVFPFPLSLSLFYLLELFWVKKYKKNPQYRLFGVGNGALIAESNIKTS